MLAKNIAQIENERVAADLDLEIQEHLSRNDSFSIKNENFSSLKLEPDDNNSDNDINKQQISKKSGKPKSTNSLYSKESVQDGKYPKIVILFILNIFCERYAYFGIRTVLYVFLTEFLLIDKDTATAIYHAFTLVCYLTPILGAIIADGYIGLYKTILYVSCLYCSGEIILAVFSMKPLGAPSKIGPMIGLMITALGSGGKILIL
jgi:hypothetical protein